MCNIIENNNAIIRSSYQFIKEYTSIRGNQGLNFDDHTIYYTL